MAVNFDERIFNWSDMNFHKFLGNNEAVKQK